MLICSVKEAVDAGEQIEQRGHLGVDKLHVDRNNLVRNLTNTHRLDTQ
jgi:hypothetical protein